ncbi:MAG: biotin/lipoyl-binding protein [Sphingobacteriales bacterium]|nr:biotin/lipoyl-binding protein [Sphingobacteriales bacterium]
MKHTIALIVFAILVITSCRSRLKKIEGIQGRVKFESISVAPKLGGRIEKINVIEGQAVRKGDTLAVLDIPEITPKLQQAEGAIVSAQGQMDLANSGATGEQIAQVESQLTAAREQLLFAEKSFQRVTNMYADSLIPAQQYDETKMKVEAARAQVKTIEAKLAELRKGTRAENKKTAMGQVERAIGAKNEALVALNERYIIAPADMTIETIALKEGELALPGYTFFSGLKKSSVYFRFTVSEDRINTYKTDQQVIVTVPNTALEILGKIIAVKQLARYADNTSTSPNYELGQATYELKVVAEDNSKAKALFQNSTVLLKEVK